MALVFWSCNAFVHHDVQVTLQQHKFELQGSTYTWIFFPIKNTIGDFPGVQWLGICMPMQGTQVRSLIWKDPTCRRAIKAMPHNWTRTLGPTSCNYRAHMLQLLKPRHSRAHAPQQEKPPQWEAHRQPWRVAPLTTTNESLHAPIKTQHSQKWLIKKILQYYKIHGWLKPRTRNQMNCR